MGEPDILWDRVTVSAHSVPEATRAFAAEHRTSDLRVTAGDAAFAFDQTIAGTPRLSLESLHCTGIVTGVRTDRDRVTIAWLKAGSGTVRGQDLPIGQPTLFRNEPDPFRWAAFQNDAMHVARDVVETIAAERGGWEPGPLEFDPLWVPDGPPLAAWWVVVRQVADAIFAGPASISPAREQHLARLAASGLLTAIPHWPAGQPDADPAQSRLARAERYILDHAREEVDVADAAAAGGISVRGLQLAFRREHGTTPLTFLRGVRLNLVRAALLDGEEGTVGEVARRNGVTHLGRFAAAYRAAFGELPRDTRRNAGSAAAEWQRP
jgi:AraC-like DNA-binding protein